MNRNTTLISVLLIMASALFSCTERGLDPVSCEKGEFVNYGFYMSGTKAGSSSTTTYRAMLHNHGNHKYTDISGTYRATASSEKAWLLPCYVDSTTGVWQKDSLAFGLRAMRNKYYISFVSPAVAPESYKGTEDTEWGFHMYRDSSVHPNLYVSRQIEIDSLKGNYLENTAVYDFGSDSLRVMKSKVRLKIKCASTSTSITVQKAGLTYLYQDCYYNLRLDTLEKFTTPKATDTVFVQFSPSSFTLAPGAEKEGSELLIFSLDYSKKYADNPVYVLPEVDILLSTGKKVSVKLSNDLKPMKRYLCTITIDAAASMAGVSISCDREEWCDSANDFNTGLE